MNYVLYHGIALITGIILDWIIGDPYWMPHPIRLIGRLIGALDRAYMGENKISLNPKKEKMQGIFIVLITTFSTLLITGLILVGAYLINLILGIIVEAILTFYVLAAKSLKNESMKVYRELEADNLEKARYNVSMIVGRDTDCLDKEGVTKAATETVAENTSDGVIAPLIYAAIGGPILALTYKAINTMDSMIGYHNDRYEHLGFAAAKLDDVVNYLPSRISAIYMIGASFILGLFANKRGEESDITSYEGYKMYDAGNALFIWKRDRLNHKSPNSAQTESVAAGSLGIRLAGPSKYFGKVVHKPYIGDERRKITSKDIVRVNKLMYVTEILCLIDCLILIAFIYLIISWI